MMHRLITALCFVVALGTSRVAAGLPLRQVEVIGARIHLSDVFPGALGTSAGFDLGPAPQAGGSRLLTRSDLVAVFDHERAPVPHGLPDAVRVVRKVKHLAAWDVDALVRTAMAPKPLRRGVVLAIVNAAHPLDVAEGYARVEVDVPRAPKRAGAFSTSAVLTFLDADDQVLTRVSVPIVLAVSEQGATFDAIRGSALTLVVRRNLVEVRVPGVATLDADVGDFVPVQLKGSGRLIHARLLSKDEALEVEGSR